MLVVGGIGTLTGAVMGVVVLSLLIEGLRALERGVAMGELTFALPGGLQEILLGVVMIAILARRPAGLFAREFAWPAWLGARRASLAKPANVPAGDA